MSRLYLVIMHIDFLGYIIDYRTKLFTNLICANKYKKKKNKILLLKDHKEEQFKTLAIELIKNK